MPADVAFDTITTIQRLRGAGIEQAHAEAITASIHAGVTGGVATKADVELAKSELDGKIDALGAEMKTELKWIKIIGGTIVGLLILPWLAALVGTTLPGP